MICDARAREWWSHTSHDMTPHIPPAIATIAPHLTASTLCTSLTLTELNLNLTLTNSKMLEDMLPFQAKDALHAIRAVEDRAVMAEHAAAQPVLAE